MAFVFELISKIGVSLKLFFNIYSCQLNNNRKIISVYRTIRDGRKRNQFGMSERKNHMYIKAQNSQQSQILFEVEKQSK